MVAVIMVLIALVSGVQLAGDRLAKRLNRRPEGLRLPNIMNASASLS